MSSSCAVYLFKCVQIIKAKAKVGNNLVRNFIYTGLHPLLPIFI
jgi:hypothetical protein